MSRWHNNIFLAKDSKEEAVENDTVTFMTARTKIKTTGLYLVLSEFYNGTFHRQILNVKICHFKSRSKIK